MASPSNTEVVRFLFDHSALLELSGDSSFRVRAFANAARMIDELEVDVADMAAAGTLTSIEGVGQGVAELVTEFVESGKARDHDELRGKVPRGLLDVLRIPGLGTRKVKAIYDALNIAGVEELEQACRSNEVSRLPGFGVKTEQNILRSIQGLKKFRGQYRFGEALDDARTLCDSLRAHPEAIRVSIAGSLRRCREIVKDIDLVVSSRMPTAIADAFATHPLVVEVMAQGETKTSVRLLSGIQADLRVVSDEHFPSILHHFTGSADHNVQMRSRALARDMHLNEYGLSRGDEAVACEDEIELFKALDLPYIPPELREGLGELSAAEGGRLPDLISADQIRGALHVHSDYSDGSSTLEEMAEAVRSRGLDYVGFCDHSKSAGYVFGLKEDDVRQQHEEIDRLNREYDNFRIFKGIESDILKDGGLDYDDDVLDRFDFVVIAVHAPLNMTETEMTRRVVKAIEHPASTILAHPTGRILLEREGIPINIDDILAAAAEHGVSVELNAHPHRLDLDWRHLRKARELGVKIAINTDAHSTVDLDYIHCGVGIARKGWLTSFDVLNALDTEQIERHFTFGRSIDQAAQGVAHRDSA
jgi:DNA polymerase (family 10)